MKVEGIVLAAGLSRRAGTYKMTLKLGQKTIIERCIESMYDYCSRVIVVGGYKIEMLIPVLEKYDKVETIYNENFKDGMFSSIKEGVKKIREEQFFLTPGDFPVIGSAVYGAMLKASGDVIIPVYKGIKGHPVLMKSKVAKELILNAGYSSLREAIASKKPQLIDIYDRGVLEDVDTLEDYEKLLSSSRNR